MNRHTPEEIIEALGKWTLSKDFFFKSPQSDGGCITVCPIMSPEMPSQKALGYVNFFGGFDEYSFAYNLDTCDPVLIRKMKAATMANRGWERGIKLLQVRVIRKQKNKSEQMEIEL